MLSLSCLSVTKRKNIYLSGFHCTDFGAKKSDFQANSLEKMDHIRKTMMQHEALFKEQVQALHELYNIQKAAMREIRRRNYSQTQVFALNPEGVVLVEGQFHGSSVLEGKPLRPVYTSCLARKEDALALSLRPFWALKEFKGSGLLWIDGIGAESFPAAKTSKAVRNFDLEKLPEEEVDLSTDIEGISKQRNGSSILVGSSELLQDLGSLGTIASTNSKSEEPCNTHVGMDCFPKCDAIRSQDSSMLLQHEPKDRDEFSNQRAIDSETKSNAPKQNLDLPAVPSQKTIDSNNDQQKNSSNDRNSVQCHDTNTCKDKDACVSGEDSPGLDGYCFEEGQTNICRREAFVSECKEVLQFSQDVLKPVSSTHRDSESKFTDNNSHSNSEPGSMTSLETPEDNLRQKGKSVLYEECENLAAEILLSFAPNKAQADSENYIMESADQTGNPWRDLTTTDAEPSLFGKRCADYCSSGAYGPLSWTKSANRRRTVRRHR